MSALEKNRQSFLKIQVGYDSYIFLPLTKETMAFAVELANAPRYSKAYTYRHHGEQIGDYFIPSTDDTYSSIEVVAVGRVKFADSKLDEDKEDAA